uniref:Uncharacterized protein n=1 Tax=Ixodes ricinus TaxID=34613 RepID=A0A0K8RHT9_IXORI
MSHSGLWLLLDAVDDPSRGFGLSTNGPLDMRMDAERYPNEPTGRRRGQLPGLRVPGPDPEGVRRGEEGQESGTRLIVDSRFHDALHQHHLGAGPAGGDGTQRRLQVQSPGRRQASGRAAPRSAAADTITGLQRDATYSCAEASADTTGETASSTVARRSSRPHPGHST